MTKYISIPDLSFHQYMILCHLYYEDISNSRLSDLCNMSRCSVIRSCESLVKRKLITSTIIRGRIKYNITPDGVKELERVYEFFKQHNPIEITI